MKRLLIYILPFALTACATLSDVEKEAITQRAIVDARNAPMEIHLGYLNCYPLEKAEKDNCRRQIKNMVVNRKDAISWEYILPFDYEAERMGFAEFLHEQKKTCTGINQGPQFNNELNGYDVHCTDGSHYIMRFDYNNRKWELSK